jgi:hypothetical protein
MDLYKKNKLADLTINKEIKGSYRTMNKDLKVQKRKGKKRTNKELEIKKSQYKKMTIARLLIKRRVLKKIKRL